MKWSCEVVHNYFAILRSFISVLHTQQLLVFAVSWLRPPFTSLFFPAGSEKERAAFSRSQLDEAAAEAETARIMFAPSGCSWVTAQPPSEPTLFSCCVVACAPPHIWHSGNSSPWKRPPLPLPRLVSSGRRRLSFFSAPSFAQSAAQPFPYLLSAGVHMAEGSRCHLYLCKFVALSRFIHTWLYFFFPSLRRRNKCFEFISQLLLFLGANIAYAWKKMASVCMRDITGSGACVDACTRPNDHGCWYWNPSRSYKRWQRKNVQTKDKQYVVNCGPHWSHSGCKVAFKSVADGWGTK